MEDALILLPLIAVYMYTRIKFLGETSYYMSLRELQTAFDSMSMAHYGAKVFTAPSLFVYLVAGVMKIKGGLFSLKLFRLLSVAGGLFGMIFSYLTVFEITGKKKYAFLEALIVATLPVYYISQRAGVGDYLFLEIVPAAFFFLLKAVGRGRKVMYVLSGVFFGVLVLTAPSAYIIVLPLLALVSVYMIITKKAGVKDVLSYVIPPLVFVLIMFITGAGRCDVGFTNIPSNIMNIKSLVWDDGHPFNIASSFGTIYVFSVPVLILGAVLSIGKVIASFKNKVFESHTVIWMYILIAFIVTLTVKDADIVTANPLFFAAGLLITQGLIYISENLKWAYILEIATYTVCLAVFGYFYFVNFNSSVNNSTDHEQGLVVDKSVGEAVKTSLKMLPDRDVCVIADDFGGRNLMIALYGDAAPSDYDSFKDEDSFSFGKVTVNPGDTGISDNTVYVVEQGAHQDVIDELTAQGWANIYLKEYTLLFRQ